MTERFKSNEEMLEMLESANAEQKYKQRRDPKLGTKLIEGIVVGRDRKVIPPEEVQHLASLGCTNREMCGWFGISKDSLRYNFTPYLEKGRSELYHSLRRAQIAAALAGNPTMLIWLGKQYLQQSDAGAVTDANQVLPWTDSDIDINDADFVEVESESESESDPIQAAPSQEE